MECADGSDLIPRFAYGCALRTDNLGSNPSPTVASTRAASACTSSEAIAVSPFAFRGIPSGQRVPCRHSAVHDGAQAFARGSVRRTDGHPIDDARVKGGERM